MSRLSDVKKDDNYAEYLKFFDYLLSENKKYNLTSIENREEFLIKHVADSLAFCELYEPKAKIAEIGSGAGFPSVPIKIKRRDLSFTLIESNEKKAGFLKNVKSLFGFEDFECISGRAEELSKSDMRENFDYAIARAVAPLNQLCELLLPFVKTGGFMVAYKGKNYKEEISASENALEILGGIVSEVKEYELDDKGSRALVVIKKVRPTPDIYPRRYAKIKKYPL